MPHKLLCLACLLLAGCVESPSPLETGITVSDPALIGTWKSDLDGDPMVATIRQDSNGRLVADVQAYWEFGSKAATKRYEIVLAQFDEHRYASFRAPDLSPNYWIARYVFEGRDRFCLHAASTEHLAQDLERQRIPGKLRQDPHMATVELNASPEQLRDYFAAEGAQAFDDTPVMAFERTAAAVLAPPRSQEERDRDPPGFNEVRACKSAQR